MTAQPETTQRIPLSRERVLGVAVEQADQGGLSAVSMRKLAQSLGVEAMSLYNHVDNKEDVLDGMLEIVMEEINQTVDSLDRQGLHWKTAMRNRILAARAVLLQHKWAPSVMETRTRLSPATIRYHDELLGIMIEGGFTFDIAHHAMHALGSRALGFTQELFEPEDGDEEVDMEAIKQMSDLYPNITAMLAEVMHEGPETTLGWCDDQSEFEFGLDLILNGLDALIESP